ncbi:MAG: T9SS type A sorting domain-containing protein, partial [Bacteroidota bacterium]
SILKPDYENEIAVFPNPVKDKLTMHSRWLSGARCTIGTAVDVSIYNLVGEKVLMAANCLPIAIGMRTVDCRLLPPGIYYLEITNGSKTLRTKFIKQ